MEKNGAFSRYMDICCRQQLKVLMPVTSNWAITPMPAAMTIYLPPRHQRGNIGKSMSIPFRIRATDEDMNNLRVSLLETSDFQQIESSGDSDYTIDYYPFEIMETTFTAKHVGNIKAGKCKKAFHLSARVRL